MLALNPTSSRYGIGETLMEEGLMKTSLSVPVCVSLILDSEAFLSVSLIACCRAWKNIFYIFADLPIKENSAFSSAIAWSLHFKYRIFVY